MEIQRVRRERIDTISSFLAENFHTNSQTDLLGICADEHLIIHEDDYGNHFDGLLVWDYPKFHIHLNVHTGNTLLNKKGRFTLAHELGHFFIDSHREGIMQGAIKPHGSKSNLIHSNAMESEADYFAGALLMPRERLRRLTARRKFSLDIIKEVSREFNVSLTSALIRFAEVGTHGVMAVFCDGNRVKWYCKSTDFPDLAHRFKKDSPLPPTSVIGESFLKNDAQYTTVEKVDLEDWFYWKRGAPRWQLYEQCFYSDTFGYAISLVWFE